MIVVSGRVQKTEKNHNISNLHYSFCVGLCRVLVSQVFTPLPVSSDLRVKYLKIALSS